MKMIKLKLCLSDYLWNVFLGLDQLLNTFLGGYPDETLSCRAYRKAQAGQWFWRAIRRAIDIIFFWQDDHCRAAYESEFQRNHSPRELAR